MSARVRHLTSLLIAIALVAAACGDDDTPAPAPPPVTVIVEVPGETITVEVAPEPPPPRTNIKVTTLHLCSETHVGWAVAKGLYAAQGIEVELLETEGSRHRACRDPLGSRGHFDNERGGFRAGSQ